MPKDTIYIFHKNGAKSHYRALDYLLRTKGQRLKHREFSVLSNILKAIFSLNSSLLKKQLINISFMLSLLFSKDKKVVLGIAPFDSKLGRLMVLLKKHKIYYHTSWTCWDKSFHPKSKNNSPQIFETWRIFLEEYASHIFAVTHHTKNELLKNYNISEAQISVVYHSLKQDFTKPAVKPKKELSFIYLGRLVPQKGLKEVLDFFAEHQKATFTVVGDGKEEHLVKEFSDKFSNILHIPFTNDLSTIINLLATQQYLVLNSKRTSKWEELFGMVIIEGMAQGVIPITTNHSGPKEIVTKDIGYLCEEGQINTILKSIIETEAFDYNKSSNAKEKAKKYLEESISSRWSKILEE